MQHVPCQHLLDLIYSGLVIEYMKSTRERHLKLHEEMFGAALKPNGTHVFVLAPTPELLGTLLVVRSKRFGKPRDVNRGAGPEAFTAQARVGPATE